MRKFVPGKTTRYFAFVAAIMLFMHLSAREAVACSIVDVRLLSVRCGSELVRITYEPYEETGTNLANIFLPLDDACEEAPAEMARFFGEPEHQQGEYVRWSATEEAALRTERDTLRFNECSFRDYQRIGSWLEVSRDQRAYCFDDFEQSPCSSSSAALLPFVIHAARTLNLDTLLFLSIFAAPLLLGLAYLARWRLLTAALRPRLLDVVCALAVGGWWFWLHASGGFTTPPFVIDALFVAVLAFVVGSMLFGGALRLRALGRAGHE